MTKPERYTGPRCDRCSYDAPDPDWKVPEFFQDQYQDICAYCAKQLIELQHKLDPHDPPDEDR